MVARAIDLLTRNYTSNMVARSKNKRWIVYQRRRLPCLIDTQSDTEELLGWSRDLRDRWAIEDVSAGYWQWPTRRINGNLASDQGSSCFPNIANSPRDHSVDLAASIWPTQTTAVRLIKLLHPKGKMTEPNPITADIKEWKGDELHVSVEWGHDATGAHQQGALVAWDLSKHSWRVVSPAAPANH